MMDWLLKKINIKYQPWSKDEGDFMPNTYVKGIFLSST